MTLVADSDVPDPIIRALEEVRYEIVRVRDLGLSRSPDQALLARTLELGGVLVTRDTGIPSQAYLFEYAEHGLTVVVLRWKTQMPKDWQEMLLAILRDGDEWRHVAAQTPSIISVTRARSRIRPWSTVSSAIADRARSVSGT